MTRVRLTDREVQTLRLLAQGLTTKEIAYRMRVSPRTVYNHITHLKEKLGANSRAQLILKAIELTDENLTGED